MAEKGRKTKLTPELQEEILKYLSADNYFETTCWAVGITPQTGYNWLKRGERESAGIFREFYVAVKKAEAKAEIINVAYIKAGSDNWQSRAWILERKFWKRWGKKEKHEITGEDGKPLEVKGYIHISPDDWDKSAPGEETESKDEKGKG